MSEKHKASTAFIIESFDTGDPSGLRKIERKGETIYALFVPREQKTGINEIEGFNEKGSVYMLIAEENDKLRIYVGETNRIENRFNEHLNKGRPWADAVIYFTNKDKNGFSLGETKYLQWLIIKTLAGANYDNVVLDNGNKGSENEPSASDSDKVLYKKYLKLIMELTYNLGIKFYKEKKAVLFENLLKAPTTTAPTTSATSASFSEEKIPNGSFVCNKPSQKIVAYAECKDGIFTVLAGSECSLECSGVIVGKLQKRREALLRDGILKKKDEKFIFTRSYAFDSPSAAAEMVRGSNCNGWDEWRDSVTGKKLSELRSAQATKDDEVSSKASKCPEASCSGLLNSAMSSSTGASSSSTGASSSPTGASSSPTGASSSPISSKNQKQCASIENGVLPIFYLNRKDIPACCQRRKDGFVVLRGSKINPRVTKSCPPKVLAQRELYKDMINENNILMQEVVCTSPSAAAGFVIGASVNGYECWKTNEGLTFKDFENQVEQ